MAEQKQDRRKIGVAKIRTEMEFQIRLMERQWKDNRTEAQQARIDTLKAAYQMLDGDMHALESLFE